MNPVLVERADTRPVRLPVLRRRVSWWHPVCIILAVVATVLLVVGVTL